MYSSDDNGSDDEDEAKNAKVPDNNKSPSNVCLASFCVCGGAWRRRVGSRGEWGGERSAGMCLPGRRRHLYIHTVPSRSMRLNNKNEERTTKTTNVGCGFRPVFFLFSSFSAFVLLAGWLSCNMHVLAAAAAASAFSPPSLSPRSATAFALLFVPLAYLPSNDISRPKPAHQKDTRQDTPSFSHAPMQYVLDFSSLRSPSNENQKPHGGGRGRISYKTSHKNPRCSRHLPP